MWLSCLNELAISLWHNVFKASIMFKLKKIKTVKQRYDEWYNLYLNSARIIIIIIMIIAVICARNMTWWCLDGKIKFCFNIQEWLNMFSACAYVSWNPCKINIPQRGCWPSLMSSVTHSQQVICKSHFGFEGSQALTREEFPLRAKSSGRDLWLYLY